MDGLKEALQYAVELSAKQEPVIEIDGEKYVTVPVTKITEPILKEPFKTTTLQGVVDYIKGDVDYLVSENCLTVHIESPTRVMVYSRINSEKKRELLLEASAITPKFATGQYMDAEMFNIELLSKFEPTDPLRTIMQLAGTIKEGSEQETIDDGISQRVVAKVGVVKYENIEIENPFSLIPFRTFTEVDQPASYFIFRIQRGPKCALFDCGDTFWRNAAMDNIKAFLSDNLEGCNVKIIM